MKACESFIHVIIRCMQGLDSPGRNTRRVGRAYSRDRSKYRRSNRPPTSSRRGVLPNNVLDLFLICLAIFFEEIEGLRLCRRFGIRVIQKILNSQKNLLDCDSWLPSFLLVQDRKTNSARRIDVRVK